MDDFESKKLVFYLFITCFVITGCMSLGYRYGDEFENIEPGPYPGLRTTGQIIEQSFQSAEEAGMIYGMWFYWVPDIPFSFCLDTLCLPYDLANLSDIESGTEMDNP